MVKRIITASILIACMIGIFFLRSLSNLVFDGFLFVVIIGAMYEISLAFKKAEIKTSVFCLIIYILFYGIGYYLLGIEGIALAVILGLIVSLIYFTFAKEFGLKDLGATVVTMLYPSVFLYFAIFVNHLSNGLLVILLVLFVAVFTDTFAYFVGSLVKGKKLCPSISPKKTISGAVGGLLGGMLGAVLIYFVFEVWNLFGVESNVLGFSNDVVIVVYLVLGLVGAVADEVGDLVASQLKRKAGIKDFGNIFPGHGGIMDRIDGISFVVVFVPLLIRLFTVIL